jgi:hypothetical protein
MADRPAREHVRYAHEAALSFANGGRTHGGRTRNVSRGGACASLSEAIATGIEVELELTLVFEHDVRSDSLVLPARVVWCTQVDDIYQVGFAFRPLDPARIAYLTMFLRHLDDRQLEQRVRDDDVDDRFG